MNKMHALALSMLVLGTVACQKGGSDLKTDDEKALYTVGHLFGGRLSSLELTEAELAALNQGVKDSATNKKPPFDIVQYQPKVQELFKNRMSKASEKNKTDGKAAIDKFVASEGAKTTASGLAYKILTEGTGKKPKETDVVEVHYHGTLLNGEVFDSSVQRGEKVSFPLNRVIRGWTEGLQLIGEGGKMKLMIPGDLAYGDQGAPPKIPGGATLIFEVELFKVSDGAPAPAPAAPKKGKK
jgi:FKBP-type peptidyl-prolyl cis-trans isomerase FkpA